MHLVDSNSNGQICTDELLRIAIDNDPRKDKVAKKNKT
jgi:hypothetical protein